jgi:hypothetical protein
LNQILHQGLADSVTRARKTRWYAKPRRRRPVDLPAGGWRLIDQRGGDSGSSEFNRRGHPGRPHSNHNRLEASRHGRRFPFPTLRVSILRPGLTDTWQARTPLTPSMVIRQLKHWPMLQKTPRGRPSRL